MKFLRIGLCVMLAFAVLSFGAVQVWSQSVIEITLSAFLIAWATIAYRRAEPVRWSPMNWPLLGLVAVGLLQLLFHQTAYSFLTRVELIKVLAYFLFFLILAQAFREESDLRSLAWFLMIFCFAISLLGIVQHFTAEKDIYWLPSIHVEGDPFGPYVNRNHFAGFLELTLPVGLSVLVFRGSRRESMSLLVLLTIVPISAIILAGSRAGIIAFALQLLFLALLSRTRQNAKGIKALAAVAGVAVLALGLVTWLGADKAIQRFSMLASRDVSLARRASMGKSAVHIFIDHPLEGTGLGTLASVFPSYDTFYDGKTYDHAHNDYAELLAETGVLGGTCAIAFLVLLFRGARKNLSAQQSSFALAIRSAAAVSLIGLLFHSLVDFNLHIPSNTLLFLTQVHLLTVPLPIPTERSGRGTNKQRESVSSKSRREVAAVKEGFERKNETAPVILRSPIDLAKSEGNLC
jgi:O-antigen ligase